MQVLFVHPNFPGQFGPVLTRLADEPGVECAFVSRRSEARAAGVRCITAQLEGGATASTHYCSRSFENSVWSAHAVFEACRSAPDLRPDVIVSHSGFGTSAFLPELYDAPIISLFEYWYRGRDSDLDARPEFPPRPMDLLRARARNAMILMDLEASTLGYAPTEWQRSLFPEPWRERLHALHDGVDLQRWSRGPRPKRVGSVELPAGRPVVTYVARGLEAMRGFDVFMRFAKRLAELRPEVIFLVVGSDRSYYGNDARHISAPNFREHVLREITGEVSGVQFLGTLPPRELASVFAASDLHIYLTVPFVLSWSLLNAMACECAVLASDTAPVREALPDEGVGSLVGFGDVEGMVETALELLADPERRARMGRAARGLVAARYGLDVTYPRFRSLLDEAREA